MVLSDIHYTEPTSRHPTASFSVIRTGTGTLNVVAGANVDEASLFGIYTAGTDTNLAANNKAYRIARALGADGTVLGKKNSQYEAAISTYQAYYPDHGGNEFPPAPCKAEYFAQVETLHRLARVEYLGRSKSLEHLRFWGCAAAARPQL